uniref:ZM domain-containing protein n=1 Tax=Meloidogyne hapla TaxID=6305 RepID=A0A1I8BBH3_MELHA
MRNNKKGTAGFSRYPSARSTTVRSSRFEEWPQRQQTPAFPQQQQQYSPHFEGISSQGMPQPQGQQMGSYPSPQQIRQFPVVQELQPDYFQQQGPVTHTTVYQYDQQPRTSTAYHMSSV